MFALLKRLVPCIAFPAFMIWSPAFAVDGAHVNGFSVAVHYLPINYCGGEAGPIVRYDIANGAVTGHDTIFHDIAQRTAISLDGTRIAFFRWGYRLGAKGGDGQYAPLAGTSNAPCYISIINKDGTGLKNLTQLPCVGAVGNPPKHGLHAWEAHLDWPAGDWIYYEMPNKTGIIRRVNVRTGADNFVVAYVGSNEKGFQSWDSGDCGMRRWSISLDAKWEGHQTECGGGNPIGATNFPPPEGNYNLCPVTAQLPGCNQSVSASGNFISHYFAGCHEDAILYHFPHDKGWLNSNDLAFNYSAGHVDFSMLQQWTGQNIFGCAEWIMWSANSDKWNSRMIASWGGSMAYGCGTNQVLENWVDHVAIVPTNNAKAGSCPNGGVTGQNSDFGDFWVSDPVNNPQGNKYEDETGVWHTVAPIDPDTNAVVAAFTIRDASVSKGKLLMGYDLGKNIGLAPLTVKLDGRYSTGKNLTCQWNFGDGTTGAGDTVRHTYSAVGNYTVVLTASNGTAQNQKARVISVVDQSLMPANVSQGKTVTASTAATDAPKAVDGDFGTAWGATGGNWLTVDLGSVQNFNRIILDWNGDCGYPSSYLVKISNDNSSWTTIATLGKNPWPTHDMPDTIDGAHSARYVQVNLVSTINGACGGGLKEVQVFNVPQGPFSSASTGTAPFVWKAVSDASFGVSAAKGRVGLAFNAPAQRTIALFSSDGSLLAGSVSIGTHASLSVHAASGSIAIVRVTEKGKCPVVQRIAVR